MNSTTRKSNEVQLSVNHAKTILLVDVNPDTRDTRAKTLRSLGVTVHCASSSTLAWSRYEGGSYNLVLVDFGADKARGQALADQIKARNPRQLVAFFVGWPKYLSLSHIADHSVAPVEPTHDEPLIAPQLEQSDFGRRVKLAEVESAAHSLSHLNRLDLGMLP